MLRVAGVTACHGSARVLEGVDLEVRDGERVVLLGRNGAGKTTLIRVVVGLLASAGGAVELNGERISGLPPHRIAKLGIAYVPQGRGIFPKLTVEENLLVGTRAAGRSNRHVPKEVFEFFPVLKERLGQMGGTLSGGEQQMLAIGRALCGQPKLLLLDEPAEGIQPNVVQQLGELIPDIARERRLSVLMVEQNVELASRVASRCLFMCEGRIAHAGTPEDLADQALLAQFLAI